MFQKIGTGPSQFWIAKARKNTVKTLITVALAYFSCWIINQILYIRWLCGYVMFVCWLTEYVMCTGLTGTLCLVGTLYVWTTWARSLCNCENVLSVFVRRNKRYFRSRFCTVKAIAGPGTTWANELNFVLNHAPGAGSIARPVDQQSSALPLYHGGPQ